MRPSILQCERVVRKSSLYPYLALAAFLIGLWSLPAHYSAALRGGSIAALAPLWQSIAGVRTGAVAGASGDDSDTMALLRAENAHLRTLVQQELTLLEQMARLQPGETSVETSSATPSGILPGVIDRHRTLVARALAQQLEGLPARVLYRSPATWNSSLWLDVGARENAALGRILVAVDSPVLSGGAVVGAVDYVGWGQSRVRLLTDAGFTPAVRTARGAWRDSWLAQQVLLLQRQLTLRDDLLVLQEREIFFDMLAQLALKLQEGSEAWLLAKGELHGSSQPLWRHPGRRLKGVGFNYDFADEEGPARDLRNGIPAGQLSREESLPLIKLRDLLVTTGYDGLFPPGLPVAEVAAISPLGEGDYYYELEAIPAGGDLADIVTVSVLPPVGFDPTDRPPAVLW